MIPVDLQVDRTDAWHVDKISPVNKITQEEVASHWRMAKLVEQAQHTLELPMHITNNHQGPVEPKQNRLFQ